MRGSAMSGTCKRDFNAEFQGCVYIFYSAPLMPVDASSQVPMYAL